MLLSAYDQSLDDYDNKGLFMNFRDHKPVRVFAGGDNRYRDWGFWQVIDFGTVVGLDGFMKLVYTMEPLVNETTTGQGVGQLETDITRYMKYMQRKAWQQSRYAPELRKLKEAYHYTCQINNHYVPGVNRGIVEVHHLERVSLGGMLVSPNNSNEIVLCPNCHALFDCGALWIDPENGVTLHHVHGDKEYEGKLLSFIDGHRINKEILFKVKKDLGH